MDCVALAHFVLLVEVGALVLIRRSFLIAAEALRTPTRNGYNAQGVRKETGYTHKHTTRTTQHTTRQEQHHTTMGVNLKL